MSKKMNILVCSRISFPDKDRTLPTWEHLRNQGHNIVVESPQSFSENQGNLPFTPDAIISMGVTIMEETEQFLGIFPDVPMFAYNWDCYKWVWGSPRPGEYDYKRYGELLKRAQEVWVPSDCTGWRTTEWWGIPSNRIHTIKSACPYWEWPDDRITDEGYVLCCLREIPDPRWDWLEQACKDLKIPLVMTRHECEFEEYQRKVIGCSFIVAHLYELSTGGLSLMEAYYHGKPVLINDSKYNAGSEYFGNRANYFRDDDYKDLCQKLNTLFWGHIPRGNPSVDYLHHCRKWVKANYTDEIMADVMVQRMQQYIYHIETFG